MPSLYLPTPNLKFKKSFTLIELLVVIGILAVISSVVIISTNYARAKGKDARRKQDLAAIGSALTSYYTDHKQYPPSNPSSNGQRDFSSASGSNWLPDLVPYLNSIPKDPLQSSITNFLAKNFKDVGKLASNLLAPNVLASQGQVLSIQTGILGNNNAGSLGVDNGNFGFLEGTKYTMPPTTTGFASTMSVYISGTCPHNADTSKHFELVIYSDSSGSPGTPLAFGTNTITGAGLNTVTLKDPTTQNNITIKLNAGTPYWLLYGVEQSTGPFTCGANAWLTNNPLLDTSATTHPSKWFGWTYGTPLITNPGSASNSSVDYVIFINYTYGYQDIGGLGPIGTSYATYRGDCDSNTNAYCLRVSNNLRSYVLWTKLENTNDPELATNATAKCTTDSGTDSSWTTLGSPYYLLNAKSDGTTYAAANSFNFCIKSPPL